MAALLVSARHQLEEEHRGTTDGQIADFIGPDKCERNSAVQRLLVKRERIVRRPSR